MLLVMAGLLGWWWLGSSEESCGQCGEGVLTASIVTDTGDGMVPAIAAIVDAGGGGSWDRQGTAVDAGHDEGSGVTRVGV